MDSLPLSFCGRPAALGLHSARTQATRVANELERQLRFMQIDTLCVLPGISEGDSGHGSFALIYCHLRPKPALPAHLPHRSFQLRN